MEPNKAIATGARLTKWGLYLTLGSIGFCLLACAALYVLGGK